MTAPKLAKKTVEEDVIPHTFYMAAQLLASVFKPFNASPGCVEWTGKHDGSDWHLAVNAHREKHEAGPANGMRCEVEPQSIFAWRNGWLAATIDAGGGCVLGVTEDQFIEMLEAHTNGLPPL